jgi:hypothetical protein
MRGYDFREGHPKQLDDVNELERRAWLHLANYIAAKAFVDDKNGELA